MSGVALLAWAGVALAMTLVPGADTLVVLRAALRSGVAAALATGAGVSAGVLAWGVAAAAGLAALVASAPQVYDTVRWLGAAYLVWLGLRTALGAGARPLTAAVGAGEPVRTASAFGQGLLTNLLNPKIGVFYLSVLPVFLPAGIDGAAGWGALLAAIHVAEGMAWFAVIAVGVDRVRRALARPVLVRRVERVVGAGLVALGLRLALHR